MGGKVSLMGTVDGTCPLSPPVPSPIAYTYTGWRKKTGPPYLIANILKIP